MKERSQLSRVFIAAARAMVILYLVLDGLVTPVIRPLLRWISKLGFVLELQHLVAALPAYVILLLMGIPLAIAEPAKIYALIIMSEGHFLAGTALMAGAYFVSLVIVERIYNAGEAKLKTISWFAALMQWLTGIRDRLLDFARATRTYALFQRLVKASRDFLRRVRYRLTSVSD